MSAQLGRQLIEAIDLGTLADLRGRSMLLTNDWSDREIEVICRLAEVFALLDREAVPTHWCASELHLALFFDASTRTKSSWAGAATRLGAHPAIFDGSSTQVSHGETATETGTMLGMNAHALGIRHDLILGEGNRFMRAAKSGIDDYLESSGSARRVPLINLQCDVDHPTQTLADLCWLRERIGIDLAGKTIAVSWAYSPSYAKPLSVPQGLIMLLTRFGMHVRLAHPAGYQLMPEATDTARRNASAAGGSFVETHSMDEAFTGADVVYPKSWGPYDLMLERVEAHRARDSAAMREIEQRALERNAAHRSWICDDRRMDLTRDASALYMHCLPADIGAEVSPSVASRASQDLAREANKKLYVIMALLAAARVADLDDRLRQLAA